MKLAVIPARGGSKRIPNKNIRNFCGHPMIAWSIIAAQKSNCFDHIIVSTDDQDIADISKKYGADVPFFRPAELADDYTPIRFVINHAIQYAIDNIGAPSHTCHIQATAPFCTPEILQNSLSHMETHNIDFIFSCGSFPYPIQRALTINNEGRAKMISPENYFSRSQDLEETFHDAGQFYWGTTKAFLTGKSIFTMNNLPWIIPRHLVQDIDTEEDWKRAELMFQALHGKTYDPL